MRKNIADRESSKFRNLLVVFEEASMAGGA